MSWGRGVHNEKLKRSQRLALSGTSLALSTSGIVPNLIGGDGSDATALDNAEPAMTLRVVQHPGDPEVKLNGINIDPRYSTVCYLNPKDHTTMQSRGVAVDHSVDDEGREPLFVFARTFPKMVLRARPHSDCPIGCIVMSEIQRQNLEVTNRDKFEFRQYNRYALEAELRLIHIEVRTRIGDGVVIRKLKGGNDIGMGSDSSSDHDVAPNEKEISDSAFIIDAADVRNALSKRLFGCIVTRFERFLVRVPLCAKDSEGRPQPSIRCGELAANSVEVICTVSETRMDKWCDSDGTSTLVPDDCFRGFVGADTMLCVTAQDANAVTYTVLGENFPPADAGAEMPRLCVTVRTSDDDEEFVVRRRLLAPCIALTKYVQAGTGKYADVSLDEECVVAGIGCCCFDRVLLYLESEMRGQGDHHEFDLEYTQEMLAAAERLSIFGLIDLCQAKLGEFESRVRKSYIRWNEIVRRNGYRNIAGAGAPIGKKTDEASGGGSEPTRAASAVANSNNEKETLLIIAGGVYDVTRWLPEHPGGNTIIPKQAVNKDATVFFELYHSSRKSFVYLKQFYIGELHPEDLPLVPPAGKTKRLAKPSPGFLEQIREHTLWRVKPEEKEHKSF